jgi:hypothetical protein
MPRAAVIAQMFEWTWDSIAAECTNFLGPTGLHLPVSLVIQITDIPALMFQRLRLRAEYEHCLFTFLSGALTCCKASPPQEHVTGTRISLDVLGLPKLMCTPGSQWWTDYQPVSYTLTSKRGNRAQFSNMVTTCHKAGVKVIAGESRLAKLTA